MVYARDAALVDYDEILALVLVPRTMRKSDGNNSRACRSDSPARRTDSLGRIRFRID